MAAIAANLPAAPYRTHADDLAWQRGGAVTELVAWCGPTPVGSGFLHWYGPRDRTIAELVPDCPEIFRLEVLEQYRSKGIGVALIERLEALAKARGHVRVGLGVGVANHRARSLYERLGYRATAWEYIDLWDHPDSEGRSHRVEERCIFMVKDIDSVAG